MSSLSPAHKGPLADFDPVAKWKEFTELHEKHQALLAAFQESADDFFLFQDLVTLEKTREAKKALTENVCEMQRIRALFNIVLSNKCDQIQVNINYTQSQIDAMINQSASPVASVRPEHRERLETYIWTRLRGVTVLPPLPWDNVRMLERTLLKLNVLLPYWFFQEYRSLLPDSVIPEMTAAEEPKVTAQLQTLSLTPGPCPQPLSENPFAGMPQAKLSEPVTTVFKSESEPQGEPPKFKRRVTIGLETNETRDQTDSKED